MELQRVTEGATDLLVPERHVREDRGPSSAGSAFYNHAMAGTRDVSVLLARAEGRDLEAPRMLDGLAAAGARGLRVAREAPGWQVTLNDRDGRALEVVERNAEALGVEVETVHGDLRSLCRTAVWRYVDVDPYGSPVPFLPAAFHAVRGGGVLGVTATDTTALHGVKRAPGRRRYLGEPPPREAPGWKAAASRYLLACLVRVAAQADRAATPLLAYHHQHAIRAFVRVEDGAQRADGALDQVEERVLCPSCFTWGEASCVCGEAEATGPYWTGALHDLELVEAMLEEAGAVELATPEQTRVLLQRLVGEAGLGPFPLDIDRAVKALDLGGPPARESLGEALEAAGIPTTRTHYSPNALAYDGDPEQALEVLVDEARAAAG